MTASTTRCHFPSPPISPPPHPELRECKLLVIQGGNSHVTLDVRKDGGEVHHAADDAVADASARDGAVGG